MSTFGKKNESQKIKCESLQAHQASFQNIKTDTVNGKSMDDIISHNRIVLLLQKQVKDLQMEIASLNARNETAMDADEFTSGKKVKALLFFEKLNSSNATSNILEKIKLDVIAAFHKLKFEVSVVNIVDNDGSTIVTISSSFTGTVGTQKANEFIEKLVQIEGENIFDGEQYDSWLLHKPFPKASAIKSVEGQLDDTLQKLSAATLDFTDSSGLVLDGGQCQFESSGGKLVIKTVDPTTGLMAEGIIEC